MAHWDAAYGTLARFERELPDFAEELDAAFPPPTVFIYRTPTFFAGDDALAERNRGRRWMSSAKTARMHALALAALRRSPLAARLLVWDVYAIGEARPLAATLAHLAACQNGHERAEDIALENQVLFNLVCG